MSLTFSLSDMIYEQVLLPMKKEKYYLYTLLLGAVLNIGGSIYLGNIFKEYNNNPAIGVAIATMLTDIIVLINLIVVAKEYVIKALFNKNTLKLVGGGICVLITSFLIAYVIPLKNDIVKIILTVCVGAVVYIVSLALLKEDLVYSFIRKKNK